MKTKLDIRKILSSGKSPGSKKSGSPKPGTKATIQKVVEPKKGASMAGAKAAKKTSKTVRGTAVAAYGAGKALETAYKVGKDQGKKEEIARSLFDLTARPLLDAGLFYGAQHE